MKDLSRYSSSLVQGAVFLKTERSVEAKGFGGTKEGLEKWVLLKGVQRIVVDEFAHRILGRKHMLQGMEHMGRVKCGRMHDSYWR